MSKMASTMNGMAAMKGWTQVKLVKFGFPLQPPVTSVDLCEDCREVFSEQFMKGANVHAITMPPGQNVLPHDNVPYQDCLLAFDPEKGGFICEHDDPERFLKLQRDRAQNVAEGVPEQKAPSIGDWADAIRDPDHPLRPTLDENRRKIAGMADDMKTAGYAHSIPQRCAGDACSEQHTYTEGCLLAGVVQAPPRKFTPCRYCDCTQHLGLRCSSTGCECYVSTAGEELSAAYSDQAPVQEGQ